MPTTYVKVETDWYESQGDAVTQASYLIQQKITSTSTEIESNQGHIYAVDNPSITVVPKEVDSQTFFKAAAEASIEWSID